MTHARTPWTPGPWRWTQASFDHEDFSRYVEDIEDGHFDALWSDEAKRPVFVAQDASSYAASCDFKNDVDATLIALAPKMAEMLSNCSAALTYALLAVPQDDPLYRKLNATESAIGALLARITRPSP